MATQQELTAYLDRTLRNNRWPRADGYSFILVDPVARQFTAEQLAEQLLQDAEFRALQLGTWLQTPDGELIERAVLSLTPQPLREDITLLADALKLAAKAQREQGVRKAIDVGGVIVLGSAAVAGLVYTARHPAAA